MLSTRADFRALTDITMTVLPTGAGIGVGATVGSRLVRRTVALEVPSQPAIERRKVDRAFVGSVRPVAPGVRRDENDEI
jgi:hypothetical protein